MAAVAGTSTGVGFDADEVAFALRLPRMVAQNQVALALDLTRRLPHVLDALRRGLICLARARVFSDVLTPARDDTARDLADRFLPPAAKWTASQLRARLLKALLDLDPDAAKARYERSIEERRVSLSHNDDTTACLSGIFLPPAKAAAAFERVDAIARGMKRDGETRTLDQLRADVFCDLLAGISPASGPIVRAGAVELLVPLATLAGLSDASGTFAGYGPVIADIARQVAAASTVVGSPARSMDGAQAAASTVVGSPAGSRDGAQIATSGGGRAEAGAAVAARSNHARSSAAAAADGAGIGEGAASADARGAGGMEAVGVDPVVAAASGDVVAPQPAMPWRYRVHDEDGTLLFRGTTRARPTFEDDSGSGGTSRTSSVAREVDDVPPEPSGSGVDSSVARGSGADESGPGNRGADGIGASGSRVSGSGTGESGPNNAGASVRGQQPSPPGQADDTARFPNNALRSWINARDVTCRAPGCTAPARSCDVDHTIDHADGGRTKHDNLGVLCRHHHRLKHEGGFQLVQPEPGRFHWTSPNGRTYEALPEPP
ncbi:MAG: DUF222 domain-containing protein [Hamadaea sp.]|nr:DUF222 domain-containing protein [Hamadaea sp.]